MSDIKEETTGELFRLLGEDLALINDFTPLWAFHPGGESWRAFTAARRRASEIRAELQARFELADEKIEELRTAVQEWKEDSGR